MSKCIRPLAILVSLSILALFCRVSHARDWEVKKSTHFIVYYEEDPDFVDKVLEKAEYYYNSIVDGLGFRRFDFWTWDERAKIYIYKNKRDYIAETNQPDWSGGCVHYRDRVIKSYRESSPFLESLLPHEMAHIIFRESIGFRNIPWWLDEGVACFHEPPKRALYRAIAKEAAQTGRLLPLSALAEVRVASEVDSGQVRLSYAEASSVVEYLITQHGSYNFSDLCWQLRQGKGLDSAINAAYPTLRNIADLEDKWIVYMKRR